MREELARVFQRAQEIGLIGAGDIEPHIDHSLRYAQALGSDIPPRKALDLGSGGGLPGLVLAALWRDSNWILLDSSKKRADFLEEAVAQLRLGERVAVLCERAEVAARQPAHRHSCDLVTARSFASPAVTAECAAGFLAVAGRLLVSEPPYSTSRWSHTGLEELGMFREESPEPSIASIRQHRLVGDRFPRRVGVPEKRPLF